MNDKYAKLENAIREIKRTGQYEGQTFFCDLADDALAALYELKRSEE